MRITAPNLNQWRESVLKDIDRSTSKISDARKEVAKELTIALVANIPVWSGRTVESLLWSNTGAKKSKAPHPDRRDFAIDGDFKFHREFGATSQQILGQEARRASAETVAFASLDAVKYDIDEALSVTISSVAWPLVEQAQAPNPESARNIAVVSEIALAQVKSKFRFLK